MKHCVGRVLEFINRIRSPSHQLMESPVALGKKAEEILLRQAQAHLQDEIEKWHLEKDENGIWRFSGRLNALQTPSANLIFLPRAHHITKLLVESAHAQVMHSGVAQTLTKFRERFWIEKGRRTVTRILAACRACKRWNAQPFAPFSIRA
ncbi:unnamed protein product [Toxocara canis]|uniref:Integrase_H2C2 domain-containing protein n=1 Tax=Toxocara canis TaxID=6265 RepID=A0A183VGL6_TOXCA|nr:unnamed protein product [Toxocara canis]